MQPFRLLRIHALKKKWLDASRHHFPNTSSHLTSPLLIHTSALPFHHLILLKEQRRHHTQAGYVHMHLTPTIHLREGTKTGQPSDPIAKSLSFNKPPAHYTVIFVLFSTVLRALLCKGTASSVPSSLMRWTNYVQTYKHKLDHLPRVAKLHLIPLTVCIGKIRKSKWRLKSLGIFRCSYKLNTLGQ